MALDGTETIIEEIRAGRLVVLMDDQDRENEGDLVMAAQMVTPEHVNFMSRYGRGLICLTLMPEDCERLNLRLMSPRGFSYHGTNFTVSIEAARGVTTGISAADRAHTIRTAVDPASGPADLVQPGHLFPLMSHTGGVLLRAGHTEAACDLAKLAGSRPAGVIVEILNEDGSMARQPELEAFAEEHRLKIGTIADLIQFRMQHETSVERVAETQVQTEFGALRLLSYRDRLADNLHLAFVAGTPHPETPTLVRVHLHHPLYDLAGVPAPATGRSLRDSLVRIGAEGGVVVILRNQVSDRELLSCLHSLHSRQSGEAAEPPAAGSDLRTIGLGAQILADIGVRKMRVLSTPRRMHALAGFNLEVVEYVT